MITGDTIVGRVTGLQAARISDKELIFLNQDSDHYLGIDEYGIAIWDELETPQPINAVVESLVAEFEGDPGQIEADVFVFVEKLLNEGVLRIDDQAN